MTYATWTALAIGYLLLLASPILIFKLNGWSGITLALSVAVLTIATGPVVPTGTRVLVLGTVCALLAMRLLILKECNWGGPATHLTIGFFFLLTTVTASRGLSVTILLPLGIASVLAVVVANNFSENDRRSFQIGLVATAICQILFSCVELFVTQQPLLWGYGVYADGSEVKLPNPFLGEEFVRTQGTMGHPILFATIAVIALLIVLLGQPVQKLGTRLILAGVLSLGLVLSGTRSAVLAAFIAIVVVKIVRRKSSNRWRNTLALAAAGIAVYILDFGFRELAAKLVSSGSYSNRVQAISALPDIVSLPLRWIFLGGGFGSEIELYNQGLLQQNGFRIVDNQVVTTLVTGGLAGLVILTVLLIRSFRSADQLHFALMSAFVVMMFSFDYLRWPAICVLFFACCSTSYRTPIKIQAQEAQQLDHVHDGAGRASLSKVQNDN
ncbi:O-antigen ligase family protein [Rhodococcoides fascians]|uniref:O-antigen ligase family protein n=1 Tax=Rhodococcoides fascians TaxID=1828 RepID=UPI0012D35C22|nr:O-antigen ligase family protein [Rhodococcus fascians]